jgi:Domain of unknown function (DUF4384)
MSTLTGRRRPAGCLSDFLFDRLIASDLAGDAAAEDVRAHLASCARCRNRLAEFEAVEAPAFGSVFAQSLERKPRREAARWTLPAIALAAAAVLVVSARVQRNAESPAATRTKGLLSLDLVLRRTSGEVTRPAQGETVFPGDALRFEVTAARGGFVAVLGLDAAGAVTVYAPVSESTSHLEAGAPTVLPGSVVADSTLGPERIVAVLCTKLTALDHLRQAALRALSQAGGDPQRVGGLGTPCTETSFMIDKRNRP